MKSPMATLRFPPSGSKPNHERIKTSRHGVHATLTHRIIAGTLKLLEVVPFIARLAILKTKTAIPIAFPLARIVRERHKTTIARSTFHVSNIT